MSYHMIINKERRARGRRSRVERERKAKPCCNHINNKSLMIDRS